MRDKKLIILIVLSIVAVASLIYGLKATTKRKEPSSAKEELGKGEETVRGAGKMIPVKRRAKSTEHRTWGRNPFVPKGTKGATTLILGGIMWDEKNPRAMINGVVVGVGTKVGDSKVVDIKKDRVILNDGAEDTVLKLGE